MDRTVGSRRPAAAVASLGVVALIACGPSGPSDPSVTAAGADGGPGAGPSATGGAPDAGAVTGGASSGGSTSDGGSGASGSAGTSPPTGGGSAGGGGPAADGGSGATAGGASSSSPPGGAGGATSTGDGGSPSPPPAGGAGISAFAHKMGGLGVEWTQDLAVAPDGSITAFNVIGVRGESLEQIGFVHLDRDGNELASEFENEQGAGLHLAPWGSFAIGPSGDRVVAAAARCAGATCPTVGGATLHRGAVVRLDGQSHATWSDELPGDVLSNVDVSAAGDVLVAFQSGGAAALRKYGADGQVAWEVTGLALAAGAPVALDGAGNGVYAQGGTLVSVAGGATSWQRSFPGDVAFTALRATAGGFVALASYRGKIALGGATLAAPAGADHGWFLVGLDGGGHATWARDLGVVQETSGGGVKALLAVDAGGGPVVVTGADACTAAVAAFDPGGQPRWRRSLAVNGCGGRDVVVHGLVAGPPGRIAVGGALSGPADLGTGALTPLATDGFAVGLSP